MKKADKKWSRKALPAGSALILAVVLTSLLAIVGVLFVMISRIDKMATSTISEYKELNFAVEAVVAKISEELALDVPGVRGQEYYDYPDHSFNPGPDGELYTFDDQLINPGPDLILGTPDDGEFYYTVKDNIWLADLEPRLVNVTRTPARDTSDIDIGQYGFGHISDVYGRLAYLFQDSYDFNSNELLYWDSDGDRISFRNLRATIIEPSEPIMKEGNKADADGDGVADSRWVIIPEMSNGKGKPIYAAIRIIDNGAMLNVNTAYKFDPNDPNSAVFDIDGSSQRQVNLKALGRGGDLISSINVARGLPENPTYMELMGYERDVIWRIEGSWNAHLPFDISDELILRNRYIVDQDDTITRLKDIWPGTFNRQGAYGKNFPYRPGNDVSAWFDKSGSADSSYYIPRHIATAYNMDRIIDPNSKKMVNVNNTIAPDYLEQLSHAIWLGLYDAGFDDSALAAQIAVNIKDYVDSDSLVTYYNGYYGFESPCIYISEFAHKFIKDEDDPNVVYKSYAVELYKPYPEDNEPSDWQLVIDDGDPINLDFWPKEKQFCVIQNQDSRATLDIDSGAEIRDSNDLVFNGGSSIKLQRYVSDANGYYLDVDYRQVPGSGSKWLIADGNDYSIQSDITLHKCIRRLWSQPLYGSTLGLRNTFVDSDPEKIQAHPANKPFTNIGEIGMILQRSAYSQAADPIGPSDTEDSVRLNLANPKFQQIFNYLTVFDPAIYGWPGDEKRIKGRININTAPWFVIAQLPWITHQNLPPDDPNRYNLAKTIVAYRDKGEVFNYDDPNDSIVDYADPDRTVRTRSPFPLRETLGFETIGELATVVNGAEAVSDIFRYFSMRYYLDDEDQTVFPDLTPRDGAEDDFEERDLIFSRISNLVTVRSDIFTAYILVRIGADGPQKRVLAILDRSRATSSPGGKVRILALHPIPDPR